MRFHVSVCARKEKPLQIGKLSTTEFRLLARSRVVADRLYVFFCRHVTTQTLLEFWYISTRDQASLASAQSHHAAMSTSMSPTRCSLTPRTRLKQHGRQEHEPACEKMTCSFTFDLCRNERVLSKNLFPMGVEEAASQIHAHFREEPPHPFSQPSHARNFSRLTTRSQPIASTTSFNNCGVSGHVLFAKDKVAHDGRHTLSQLPHVRFSSHSWSCLIPN